MFRRLSKITEYVPTTSENYRRCSDDIRRLPRMTDFNDCERWTLINNEGGNTVQVLINKYYEKLVRIYESFVRNCPKCAISRLKPSDSSS